MVPWALVNNAGVAEMGYTDWMPHNSYQTCMDVNFHGLVRVTQAMMH